jgi:hypothetical protein
VSTSDYLSNTQNIIRAMSSYALLYVSVDTFQRLITCRNLPVYLLCSVN